MALFKIGLTNAGVQKTSVMLPDYRERNCIRIFLTKIFYQKVLSLSWLLQSSGPHNGDCKQAYSSSSEFQYYAAD